MKAQPVTTTSKDALSNIQALRSARVARFRRHSVKATASAPKPVPAKPEPAPQPTKTSATEAQSAAAALPLPQADTAAATRGRLMGDMNGDGKVDDADVNPFVMALSNPEAFKAKYGLETYLNGDFTGSGQVNFSDLNPFQEALRKGIPA